MNQTMISEPPSIDLDLCYDLENTSNVAWLAGWLY